MLLALNLFLGIAAASFVMAFKDHTVAALLFHRPMAMLSGAYFLVELIPNPFRWLAYANPVAYAIDVFRGALTGTTLLAPSVEIASIRLLTTLKLRILWLPLSPKSNYKGDHDLPVADPPDPPRKYLPLLNAPSSVVSLWGRHKSLSRALAADGFLQFAC